MDKTPKSVSFSLPDWFNSLLERAADRLGRSKSFYALHGAQKQLIFDMRIGNVYKIIEKIYSTPNLREEEQIEFCVKLPASIVKIIEDHCFDCGYTPDKMCAVAIPKFILCKDCPPALWQELYEQSHKDKESEILKSFVS